MLSIRSLVVSGCLLAGVVLLPGVSRADITFTTTYQSPQGPVNAFVSINGANGSYSATDPSTGNPLGSGTLFNIQYLSPNSIQGQWSWNGGGQGTFFWTTTPGFQSFNGNWSDPSGNGGQWSGNLSGGAGQLGKGGPFVRKK